MSESKSAPWTQLVHTELHSAHHHAAPRFNTGKKYMIKREAKVTAENSESVCFRSSAF